MKDENTTTLKKTFEENGYPLRGEIKIGKVGKTGKTNDNQWVVSEYVNDADKPRIYLIRGEEGRLNVYLYCEAFKVGEEYYKIYFSHLVGD